MLEEDWGKGQTVVEGLFCSLFFFVFVFFCSG